MPNLETWVSLASLGLIIMFVILMISFARFLIGSGPNGPDIFVEPQGVIVQVVTISGAPGVILSGITYGLVKNYGSRNAGLILAATGIILSAGMLYLGTIVSRIPETYSVPYLQILLYAFVGAGLGIIVVGIKLVTTKRKRNMADEGV